jgi:Methyltransferase domain
MAADFVRDHRLDGVQILTADARRTGLPSGSFDLVFSRTLLINIPQPAAVVARWRDWPGQMAGWRRWSTT